MTNGARSSRVGKVVFTGRTRMNATTKPYLRVGDSGVEGVSVESMDGTSVAERRGVGYMVYAASYCLGFLFRIKQANCLHII